MHSLIIWPFFTCTHNRYTYTEISPLGPADPAGAHSRSRPISQESRAGEQHEDAHSQSLQEEAHGVHPINLFVQDMHSKTWTRSFGC